MATTRERVSDLSKQGLSVREIASVLQVSTQAIYKHLDKLGIEPPSRRGEDGEAA